MKRNRIITGDCLEEMRRMKPNSVDLVFTSPPYEDVRTYGIDYKLRGEDWVQWAADRFAECLRVCSGLVAWVVEGKTTRFQYSSTPVLLMAELVKRGVCLRKPPIFYRNGIPGSGGPDWLRNDYEFVVCGTRERGRLAWSDNTAMGSPPKYEAGGACTNRTRNGNRVESSRDGAKYAKPKISNPGNVIRCKVGGGHMGSRLAHETEAPFPESLAEFFVRSFCRPGGVVLDPFSGSGTTAKVAEVHGRKSVSIDIRRDQCELTRRRIQEARST